MSSLPVLHINQEKSIVSFFSSSSSSSSSSPILNHRLFKPQPLSILRVSHPFPLHFRTFFTSPLPCPHSQSPEEDSSHGECTEQETIAPLAPVEPERLRRLFVGNIPKPLDHAALEALFADHGTVERAEVMLNKNQRSRKFGFVTMKTVEDAHRAVEKLHGLEMGKKKLRVNVIDKPYAPHPPFVDSPYKVFVANVPYVVTTTRLREFFSEHVPVVCARVGRVGRKRRYFGMLTFSSQEDLRVAVALSGIWLDGKKLVINEAQPWQLPNCIMMMRRKKASPK